ncbi:HlyD family secretion protein [Acetobacter sp.]|jgi:membrane fusion protein (multidrug efflux system)|uniref:HlyD family secretion protein n=1 Tax=Acetobacter sp. TaxID=440 RepID=UPI0039E79C01
MSTSSDSHPEQSASQKTEVSKSSPGKRLILIVVLCIGLIVFAVWFFRWWTHGRFVETTNDAYLRADQVAVSTRVAGFVDQVLVGDNQSVKAGQVLVKLDNRDPRARYEQAKALADQGLASIIQIKAQIAEQDSHISESRSHEKAARAEARFADREVARYRKLSASGAETNERYDQLVNNAAQAHAQLEQATAALQSAERQVATFEAAILETQARIEQAFAQQRAAKVDLDATTLVAATDGKVGDRTVRVGQYAQVGTRMMTIVPVQNLYLVANFKETQIRNMRHGQPVTVKVDALGGQTLPGEVDSFSPGTGAEFALLPPDNATGNFTKVVQRIPVRIRINPTAEQRQILVPGLSVTAEVDTKPSSDLHDAVSFKESP